MNKQAVMNNRYIILAVLIVTAAAALIVRLYDMQIVHGDEYSIKSSRKITHRVYIEAPRGRIFDRNGNVLAYNRESNDLYLTKAYTSDDELNSSLLELSLLLDENNEDYLHSFEDYILPEPVVFNPDLKQEEITLWQMDKDLFNLSERNVKNSAKELMQYLREKFGVSQEYDEKEAYRIISMRYEILRNRWNYITGGRIFLAKDVSLDTIAVVSEQRHRMRGVIIQKRMVREYGDVGDIAHVLGYVGSITPEEYERLKSEKYDSDDILGKSGIEAFAEGYLRGSDGYLEYEADERTGRLIEKISGYDEVNGNDVNLTIDMELQAVAMRALEDTIDSIRARYDGETNFGDASAGAVVAMNVKTGEILAMGSYPSFDPAWFIHDDDYSREMREKALMGSYDISLLNRAIQGWYTPGSTFKPIVAIAALESELHEYDGESLILCDGKWTHDNWDYYCHETLVHRWFTHGELTIAEGIKTSCNLVFHKLGLDVGIDEIDRWADEFGLGNVTSIDLYGEIKGIRSNKEYKYLEFNEKWWPADTGQTSIGQLFNNYTPIQLAVYTSALANGGEKLRPYLINSINAPDGSNIYEAERVASKISWSDETKAIITDGMSEVVQDGTASKAFDDYPIRVAGKTGTAETGREAEESSNGLFICYAPVEDPQIAVVVVIEKGVWGSYTAPVAKEILNEYFGLNADEEDGK